MEITVAGWINLLFFFTFLLLALARRNAPAILLGITGIALTCIMIALRQSFLNHWVPALLMPIAYWQSGRFFQKPNEKMQTFLARFDQKILGSQKRTPVRSINLFLEISYLFCYPLVPLGVGVLYFYGLQDYVEMFWLAVLPPTYFCYAMVPFSQSLPPWRLEKQNEPEAPRGRVKEANMWILRRLSTQANTFPSAHVTASLAAALALLSLLPVWGSIFLIVSVGIAIGAVVGRYHYIMDILTAILITIAGFALTHS